MDNNTRDLTERTQEKEMNTLEDTIHRTTLCGKVKNALMEGAIKILDRVENSRVANSPYTDVIIYAIIGGVAFIGPGAAMDSFLDINTPLGIQIMRGLAGVHFGVLAYGYDQMTRYY
jgi:hypothetical protein